MGKRILQGKKLVCMRPSNYEVSFNCWPLNSLEALAKSEFWLKTGEMSLPLSRQGKLRDSEKNASSHGKGNLLCQKHVIFSFMSKQTVH